MSDKPAHQRSKSSLAVNILRRERSRQEITEDGSSVTPSSPTPSRGQHLNVQSSHTGSSMSASQISASARDPALSIQQSVKMFRIVEVLRSGNQDAIAKAISDGQLDGTTILHLAIQVADPAVADQVLTMAESQGTGRARLDINAQDRDGNTPLHLAAHLGRANIVKHLLGSKGIDSTISNYHGKSALDLARTPEIFQQLQLDRAMFSEAQVKATKQAARARDYDGLERLLEDPRIQAVVDVNSPELATEPTTVETGGSLLHEAARNKDTTLCQLLLIHGADPFRRDKKGKLPQDVTKDDKTKTILKKSPAATAAQRGVQEKAILGTQTAGETSINSKESRELKGYLKKWTNYTSGYKLRWFVLEDGVLSYYKHQDDTGSACRGAMNMRIAKLTMDAEDKSKIVIEGKSSVKFHLKANHNVEAKRWFWALNNAIQWSKDEAKREQAQQVRENEAARAALSEHKAELSARGQAPMTASDTLAESYVDLRVTSAIGTEDRASNLGSVAGSVQGPGPHGVGEADEEEDYGDDASSQDIRLVPRDAFNITAHSAGLQLRLLSQVSNALQAQVQNNPTVPLSDPTIKTAISAYEDAVMNLQGMVGDLLRIARDRETFWQSRLEREADTRRLWEESMAKLAREQEELEGKFGESEEKRRLAKRALREALETGAPSGPMSPTPADQTRSANEPEPGSLARRSTLGKSAIQAFNELSEDEDDDDDDEEFFDAVGAGEVPVEPMPTSPIASPPVYEKVKDPITEVIKPDSKALLASSYHGYEDPVRTRLALDADNRPVISLWGILKSMIGKDMSKMTLPVSFNEPSSLLQRVAEDMEYTDLLDTAAARTDPTERILYVAAFAASEYASTIGRVAKPFNPLLGETYEYARPDKGYRFFVEQVSHHPPIGAAWAESASWTYYGESAVKSKFYGKSFDINPLGTWFLKLRPASGGEELYTWKKVNTSVIGIITGSPTVDNYGPMEIKNWTTGETCLLDFKARGWKASSAYQVSGKVTDADGKVRWSIGGRWNDKLYARLTPGFEAAVEAPSARAKTNESPAFLVWQANPRPSGIPFNLTPFALTLNNFPDKLKPYLPPTDTRRRPDQRAMEDGQYDVAATEKNRVEEKQRASRREREAAGEEWSPRWFKKARDAVTGEEYWQMSNSYWEERETAAASGGAWKGCQDIF